MHQHQKYKYKLSICVTTYNQEKFIREALDSILSQEVNFDYQIVIADDVSSDKTREIVLEYHKKLGDKIKLIFNEKNIGVVQNFESALNQCDSELIAILDGDDIMLPTKLQKQVDFLDNNSDCTIVTHEVRAFDSVSKKTLYEIKNPVKDKVKFTVKDLIQHGNFVSAPAKMFRKSAMPKNGFDPKINYIADYYLSIENALFGDIGYISECLSEYRIHSFSVMKNIKGINHFEVIVYLFKNLEQRFPGMFSNLFKRNLAYAYLVYAINEIDNKNYKSAREKICQSVKQKYDYSFSQYFYLVWCYLPIFDFVFSKVKKLTRN